MTLAYVEACALSSKEALRRVDVLVTTLETVLNLLRLGVSQWSLFRILITAIRVSWSLSVPSMLRNSSPLTAINRDKRF